MRNRYIIFDRDGTLIQYVPYLSKLSEVKFNAGVLKTLPHLSELGYRFGIVTNQSVIARRIATSKEVSQINNRIEETIRDYAKVKIDFVRVCPHIPEENCFCRKPKPGLLLDLIDSLKIDCVNSYMVGDSESDMVFGKTLKFSTIFLCGNSNTRAPDSADHVISSFEEIIGILAN